MSKPNFLIVASIPRFDDRDAICGYTSQLVETAETLRWAIHRLNVIWERDDLALSEIGLTVYDAATGKPARVPTRETLEVVAEIDGCPF